MMTTPLNLLIVEDRASDAKLVLEHLRAAGFDPQARVVETEADYLGALAERPDLVLCDYRLPQFDGMRALALLQARAPDIPLILISGTIGEEQAVEAMRQGASDYLFKDRLGRLDFAVRRALEQKHAWDEQQRMHAKVAHLAAIVEHSNDAIISHTLEGIILSWNPSAEQMFGWTAAEAVGQPITVIIPLGREGAMRPLINQALRGEAVQGLGSPRLRRDGTIFLTSVSISPIRDAGNRVIGLSFIYRDISERKRAEEALRASERFARSTIDALPEHLCVVDETGVIIAVNRAWRDFAAANSVPADQDWIGVNYLAACDVASGNHGSEGHVFAAGIRAVLGGKSPEYALEYPCHSPHQQRWFLGRVTRFSDEGPVYLVITHENITERKQSEHALIVSEARLRAVLDNETECIKLIGSDGGLHEMNRAGLTMLEVENIEEAKRRGVQNFVLPEYRERFERFLRAEPQQREAELVFEIEGLKGTRRWLESRATNLRLPHAESECLLVVTRDITERRHAQEQIDYLMHHDRLTGLPNRGLFRNHIERALDRARSTGEMIGVMIINIDRFERFNEGLGVQASDELLKAVAVRLRAALRDVDTVSRLGGDEFAILVERVAAVEELAAIADTIGQTLSAPFEVCGQQVFLTTSVGVGIFPDGVNTPELLMQNADAAMRRVKQDGGNGFQLHEDDDSKRYRGYLDIEQRLRHALDNGELSVHYQPKVDLRSNAIAGAEALLRWNNADLGAVSPAQFIPIAEDSGLIIPIGAWVLQAACARAAAWIGAGHPMDVAVNLSPRQFRDRHLLQTVAAALDSSGLAPQHLTLEITEGTAMSNAEHTITVLNKLHDMGIRLAVDDFGTGYSSLAYLKRFPLDSLKIDRSFVVDVCSDSNSRAIVRATVALAHSLNLKVVAEGVETGDQRDCLTAAGCDLGQGYLYGRAVPAAEFGALLKT